MRREFISEPTLKNTQAKAIRARRARTKRNKIARDARRLLVKKGPFLRLEWKNRLSLDAISRAQKKAKEERSSVLFSAAKCFAHFSCFPRNQLPNGFLSHSALASSAPSNCPLCSLARFPYSLQKSWQFKYLWTRHLPLL
jgi:hypothetical protein